MFSQSSHQSPKRLGSLLTCAFVALACLASASRSAQATPTLSINDVTVSEGNNGTLDATFTVALSEIGGNTVTVDYSTSDNTAVAGSDYIAVSGTLIFTPGNTAQTITVPIVTDTTFEEDETFFVNLGRPTNATLTDEQGVGYIVNDDSAPKGLVTSLADDGGANTLRSEIARATSGDTISFQSGLRGTITLSGTELLVQKNLSIQGPGADVLTVSAHNASRVFRFAPASGTTSMTANLFGLKITDGATTGGGIYNDKNASLIVTRCAITDNKAASGSAFGGGIYNAGTLVLNDTAISNNKTTRTDSLTMGGGLYNSAGVVTINGCAIESNNVTGYASSKGGGIYSTSGTTTIKNSTIAGNGVYSIAGSNVTGNSGVYGGGICLETGKLSLSNCTLANNNAGSGASNSVRGGGIAEMGGDLTLSNCTVASNTANSGDAGGIFVADGSLATTATFSRTIIGGNTAKISADIVGIIDAGDYNLVENGWGAVLAGTHNIIGVSPRLGALTDNGGPTKTMALQSGSLAVDAGDPTFNSADASFDQRGLPRIQSAAIDLGAVESSLVGPGGRGVVTSLADDGAAGTLRAEIARVPTGDSITFQNGLRGTIVLAAGELLVQKNTSIQGPGADVITVRGSGVGRVFHFAPPTIYAPITSILSGLAITGGKASMGAGIYNEPSSTLTCTGCLVTENIAYPGPGSGGGIRNEGTLTLDLSQITNNIISAESTYGWGAGIYNEFGKITLARTTLAGNSIRGGSSDYSMGAAIYQTDYRSTMTISDCTIANNSISAVAATEGAGICAIMGQSLVNNSTFTGNRAESNSSSATGGAIYFSGTTLRISSCTIAGNNVTAYRSASAGGIYNDSPASHAYLSNTIVAGNKAMIVSEVGSDIVGTFTDSDYNLVQKSGPTSLTGTHNIIGVNPKLTTLFNNGGPTQTMALYADSAAIDAGNPQFSASGLPNDQRGTGYPRVANGIVDIGATEGSVSLPTLSIDDISMTEANMGTTNATFTVTLTPASSQIVTVKYATSAGSATAGSDYTTASGTLTFAAGTTTQTVQVPVVGDKTIENDETFFVDLSGATNATINDAQGVGTIKNNDYPSLSINDVSLSEGNSGTGNAQNTSATFTVTLSSAYFEPVTVNYATAAGTAVATSDYNTTSGQLTFEVGAKGKTITVPVVADTTIENDETFFVNLSGQTNATLSDSQGLCTIINDDFPSITVHNFELSEGSSGTTNALFAVTLSAPSPQTINVFYVTADDTATAPSDYSHMSGMLTFVANTTSKSVLIPVKGDTVVEPDERFFLNLNGPTNATLANSQGVCTITNDDEASTATPVPTATATPVPTATATPVPTATATPVPTATATPVPTATATPVPTATATPVPTATATPVPTATATPVPPVITVVNPSVYEGNSGTTAMKFTLKLSKPSTKMVQVYAQSGTASLTPATANSDYVPLGRTTITFAPGQTSQMVTVSIKGDVLDEDNERVKLVLSSPVNATLGPPSAEGIIVDDDGVPSLSVNDVSLGEGNSGLRTMVFTITLSNSSSKSVAVKWATQNGTALGGTATQPGVDYVIVTPTPLTFAPSQIRKTVSVAVRGDVVDEDNETFFLKLGTPINARITDGVGLGTILDDDATPTLLVKSGSVIEGNGGTAKPTLLPFTITLSGPSSRTISVGMRPVAGTTFPATANIDYKATSVLTLSFAPGETSKLISVAVIGDMLNEDDERIALELSRPQGTLIARNLVEGVVTNDDAVPSLSISDANVLEGNRGNTTPSIASFTISLSAPCGKEVRVDYASFGRSAVAGGDYLEQKGTVVFVPGETRKIVPISIVGDTVVEPDELFVVVLSRVAGATISKSMGNGFILNDDRSGANTTTVRGSSSPISAPTS